ncbi:MAG TPA: ABC transporter permease [Methylomirabilota bacterium]|jgi:phospholipid/cholesterol/gamma-HCH transport system permease protein
MTTLAPAADAGLALEMSRGDTLVVRVWGPWTTGARRPAADEVDDRLASAPRPRRLAFDASGLEDWDSGLLTFLLHVIAVAGRHGVAVDREGLPEGVRRLLALATAVPERRDTGGVARRASVLARIGAATLESARGATTMLAFLGEVSLGLGRLVVGRARYRRSDLLLILQEVGAQALPIVSLISFLVGVILAYVGAVQLRQFGAQIYVADLVGIGMTREMGAMMAAVIMAGRTGAAFAAQLGTMQVNEEIDALTTLGISPIEFLVLPRMLALAIMMPLLCLYADLLGLLGGLAVGVGMLDLGVVEYYVRTTEAISIADCVAGLIKASTFGVLVAVAGCLRGIQCGRSSAAVGAATTSAVVTGIVLIIVFDALTTVIFDLIGL